MNSVIAMTFALSAQASASVMPPILQAVLAPQTGLPERYDCTENGGKQNYIMLSRSGFKKISGRITLARTFNHEEPPSIIIAAVSSSMKEGVSLGLRSEAPRKPDGYWSRFLSAFLFEKEGPENRTESKHISGEILDFSFENSGSGRFRYTITTNDPRMPTNAFTNRTVSGELQTGVEATDQLGLFCWGAEFQFSNLKVEA